MHIIFSLRMHTSGHRKGQNARHTYGRGEVGKLDVFGYDTRPLIISVPLAE